MDEHGHQPAGAATHSGLARPATASDSIGHRGRAEGPGVTIPWPMAATMTEGDNPSRRPLLCLPCECSTAHHHGIVLGGQSQKRGWWTNLKGSGSRRESIRPTMRKRVVGRAAWWMLLLLARLHGHGGVLWESGRGQDAENPPLIRPKASRAEKASMDQVPRVPTQSGFHPCGVGWGRRTASASIGRWAFASFSQPKDSMARMDHGSSRIIPWLTWLPGFPSLWAPFPSVAKHVSTLMTFSKGAVISTLHAQHDATRGAHARSPQPASMKCHSSPTWRVAHHQPPTTDHQTAQAKTSPPPTCSALPQGGWRGAPRHLDTTAMGAGRAHLHALCR
jgi:hypothetical protein